MTSKTANPILWYFRNKTLCNKKSVYYRLVKLPVPSNSLLSFVWMIFQKAWQTVVQFKVGPKSPVLNGVIRYNPYKWLIINGYTPGSIFTNQTWKSWRFGVEWCSELPYWGVNLISGEPAGEKSSGDVLSVAIWLHGFQQLPGPNQWHLHLYIQPATSLRVDNSHKTNGWDLI